MVNLCHLMAIQKKSTTEAPSMKDAIPVDPTARVASHHGRVSNTVIENKNYDVFFSIVQFK